MHTPLTLSPTSPSLNWPAIAGDIEVRPAADLTREQFAATHGQRANPRPVILRAAPLYEAVAATWTDDYLERTIGDLEVSVYVSADGTFPGGEGPHDPTKYAARTMPFREYLARAQGRIAAPLLAAGEKYYLYQSPARLYERVLRDYTIPPLIPENSALTSNFWFSSAGNVTPAHYDAADNFLVQIRGVKDVYLWPPREYPFLYLHPFGHAYSRQSPVALDRPEPHRFPAFAKARAWRGRLEPGDILFIPSCWVHHVTTVVSSISINHWWVGPDLRTFIDATARILEEPNAQLRELAAHLLVERCGHLQR